MIPSSGLEIAVARWWTSMEKQLELTLHELVASRHTLSRLMSPNEPCKRCFETLARRRILLRQRSPRPQGVPQALLLPAIANGQLALANSRYRVSLAHSCHSLRERT